MMEDNCDKNYINFMPTGKTEYSLCAKSFLEKVGNGPFYVCVICNRCLYYLNVAKFDSKKYDREFIDKLNTNVTSCDGIHYNCKTWNTHREKLNVPCQAITNGIYLENIPQELDCLST